MKVRKISCLLLQSLVILFTVFSGITILYGQSFHFDFEDGYQEWKADFADYPVGDSAHWNLNHFHQAMPDIVPVQNGLRMVGDNFSDDLFFFMKRKIEGLHPNTKFQIIFSIDVVTDMPPNAIGGSDLMLKAGATIIEPKKIVVDEDGIQYYRMNINKDSQSQPGTDMDTLGHVHHDVTDNFDYHIANYQNGMEPFEITSDSNGELWVIIGAESQFEGPAEFLIAHTECTLENRTSIEDHEKHKEIPADFELFQNHPNPFNPHTEIAFGLPEDTPIRLVVYNTLGQEVDILVHSVMEAGHQKVMWDASNYASGIYFYRLLAGDFTFIRKMILLK